MSLNNAALSNSIEVKIAWSRNCYQKFGRQLLQDNAVIGLLSGLKSAINASHKEMGKTGIVDICRDCEENDGGSCCGAGMEAVYDGWLLLTNLLLGARLPDERGDLSSCFFLRKTGCMLPARHVICVNYLCRKITDLVDPEKIKSLRDKEGEELNILFLLNERVKRVVGSLTG